MCTVTGDTQKILKGRRNEKRVVQKLLTRILREAITTGEIKTRV